MPDINEFVNPDKKKKEAIGKLAELLSRNNIDVEDIGNISKVNLWQGFHKDEAGDAQVVDLVGVTISPSWEEGPLWPVVQQAAPTKISYRPTSKAVKKNYKRTVILPDPQIGYWRMDDGTMIPMHDEAAMNVAIQILGFVKPTRIINLGDYLDASEWTSKFTVYPEFVLTTQPALDRGHEFLAQQRAEVGPNAEIDLLGGNHDNRIELAITRNSMAATRLRQANRPASWPVLSIPFLMRLEELGVKYTGAYPAGRVKIADAHGEQTPLYALHGEKLDMKKQANSERQSTVQGHTHHLSCHMETYDYDGTAQQVQSWSLGCLCRIDGAVPSTRGGVDEFGRPVRRVESWQHAIAVVTETEHGWWVEPIMIHEGRAFYKDREFVASSVEAAQKPKGKKS